MRNSLAVTGAIALLAVLATGARLHADVIQWSYSPVSPTVTISNNDIPLTTAQVQFNGQSGAASGNSAIIAYTVTTAYGPIESSPASFTNVPFNLAIQLTDIATSGQSPSTATGVVNFSGLFNATNVTKSSNLPGANTWTLVSGNNSPTEASLVLGAGNTWHTYTVDITSFTAPGAPNGAPGSIQAVVTVTPANGPPSGQGGGGNNSTTSATPEPASWLLAAAALPLCVLARRRLTASGAA